MSDSLNNANPYEAYFKYHDGNAKGNGECLHGKHAKR